jgi:hypothetical protein
MLTSYLDTAIAFVVVILGVSLLVTSLTQLISAFLGLRGSNLRWGLGILLKAGDKELAAAEKKLSTTVLTHPLISDSVFSKWSGPLSSRWRLANALSFKDLGTILESLEAAPNEASSTKAIQKVKATVAKDSALFDSTMARVSQRFTTHLRIYTVLLAAVLAYALNLDAPLLLSRLSTNAELRARLVAGADLLKERSASLLEPSQSTNANTPQAEFERKLNDLNRLQTQLHTDLDTAQLRIPIAPDPGRSKTLRLLGIAASVIFLSLGAPFWFNALKTLTSLKPVLAQKAAAPGSGASSTT